MKDVDGLPDEYFLAPVDEADVNGQASTLSFSRATTVLLTFAANRFARSTGRLYQQQFGIGAMDWRMLVMLTKSPGCNVTKASRTIGIDKGAVSRSLARLEKGGLAIAAANPSSERRRDWTLTSKGRALHNEVLAVALERQRKLLAGFTLADVERFNRYLSKFLENLEDIQGDTELGQ